MNNTFLRKWKQNAHYQTSILFLRASSLTHVNLFDPVLFFTYYWLLVNTKISKATMVSSYTLRCYNRIHIFLKTRPKISKFCYTNILICCHNTFQFVTLRLLFRPGSLEGNFMRNSCFVRCLPDASYQNNNGRK